MSNFPSPASARAEPYDSPSVMSLQQKKVELRKLEKQIELKEQWGMRFFRPHEKQYMFLSAGPEKRRYLRTGNRFGKSDVGAVEDCGWAYGRRLFFEETFDIINGEGEVVGHHEGHANHPLVTAGIPPRPTKGLILCQDWDKAEDVFTSMEAGLGQGKIWKFLPKTSIGPTSKTNRSWFFVS